MLISRKRFLQISAGSIAGIALSNLWLPKLLSASDAKNGKGRLPLIWFQAQACSGCPVSFIDTEYPGVDEVLIEVITLEYNTVIMGATGDQALGVIDRMIAEESGKYILVVDGSIPLEENGLYCTVGEKDEKPVTALEWINKIAANALAVVAVGTCAAWGGIPAAPPNPTGAVPASKVIKDKPIINIPDQKQLPPELGHVFVHLPAGSHVHGLHQRHHDRKPECQGYEKEVVNRGDTELQACYLNWIHNNLSFTGT